MHQYPFFDADSSRQAILLTVACAFDQAFSGESQRLLERAVVASESDDTGTDELLRLQDGASGVVMHSGLPNGEGVD
jgi:hypothetical protein